jgi:ribose 5-phosphate isomerase A
MSAAVAEPTDIEREKKLAAAAAAQLVEDGMRVGLGTGTTVAYLLPALAERHLDLRCVATSLATAAAAQELGLRVEPFDRFDRLDIAIDGADQVSDEHWLIKGGGGAHTREKIVAAASDRFVVIVSSDKLVEEPHPPVPLELVPFGLDATLRALDGHATIRPNAPPSPDGGIIADWSARFDTPLHTAAYLANIIGVVEHGLVPPSMVDDVFVARGDEVQHRRI